MRFIFCLSLGFSLLSGANKLLADVPTVWTITNKSVEPVQVACEGQEPTGQIRLKLGPLTVSARSSFSYEWGDVYYNDGMGLNPAAWICEVKTKKNQRSASFVTTWGEAVLLSIDQEGRLIRAEAASSVARQKTLPASPSR
jgi:hypothetical protein